MPFSGVAAANVRRARFRSSLSPQALPELCLATNAVFVEDMIGVNIFSTNALQRFESSVCQAPVFEGAKFSARAGGRHADTTGTFHRQHALLKAARSELASRLWDLPAVVAVFGLNTRAFPRPVRFRLTMPA
jgi:hypothetical protein